MGLEAFVKLGLVLFARKDFELLVSRATKVVALVSLAGLMLVFAISTIANRDLRATSLSVPLFLFTVGLILTFAPSKHPVAGSLRAAGGFYAPNFVPFGRRALRVLSSLALITYGALGLAMNDLYLPGKHGGLHLRGLAAVLMFSAILAASAHLCALVVDHYDRRDNERRYRALEKYARLASWSFFAMAILAAFAQVIRH